MLVVPGTHVPPYWALRGQCKRSFEAGQGTHAESRTYAQLHAFFRQPHRFLTALPAGPQSDHRRQIVSQMLQHMTWTPPVDSDLALVLDPGRCLDNAKP